MMNSLIDNRRPLEADDLWQLEPEHSTKAIWPKFEARLRDPRRKGKVYLGSALTYSFGPRIFLGCAIKIFADMLSVLSPQSE